MPCTGASRIALRGRFSRVARYVQGGLESVLGSPPNAPRLTVRSLFPSNGAGYAWPVHVPTRERLGQIATTLLLRAGCSWRSSSTPTCIPLPGLHRIGLRPTETFGSSRSPESRIPVGIGAEPNSRSLTSDNANRAAPVSRPTGRVFFRKSNSCITPFSPLIGKPSISQRSSGLRSGGEPFCRASSCRLVSGGIKQ